LPAHPSTIADLIDREQALKAFLPENFHGPSKCCVSVKFARATRRASYRFSAHHRPSLCLRTVLKRSEELQ
jgi:hypothetical protein